MDINREVVYFVLLPHLLEISRKNASRVFVRSTKVNLIAYLVELLSGFTRGPHETSLPVHSLLFLLQRLSCRRRRLLLAAATLQAEEEEKATCNLRY